MSSQYKSTGRAVSDLKAHLVLTTKYRRTVLTPAMLKRLEEIVAKFCNEQGCLLLELNGEPDHIHILFDYYPQLQLSKFVNIPLLSLSGKAISRSLISQSIQAILLEKLGGCICC
jgi:putative transposase